jgi:hypothetical protein
MCERGKNKEGKRDSLFCEREKEYNVIINFQSFVCCSFGKCKKKMKILEW